MLSWKLMWNFGSAHTGVGGGGGGGGARSHRRSQGVVSIVWTAHQFRKKKISSCIRIQADTVWIEGNKNCPTLKLYCCCMNVHSTHSFILPPPPSSYGGLGAIMLNLVPRAISAFKMVAVKTGLNNVCACAACHGARSLGITTSRIKMAAFSKFCEWPPVFRQKGEFAWKQ